MNRAFQIGIMLAVAVHMVFGCCLHHAHTSDPSVDLSRPAEATCPREHDDHQQDGRPCRHGGNDQGCDEGTCTFFRRDTLDRSAMLAVLECLPLVSCVPAPPALSKIETLYPAPNRFGEPIPLHLLNQVLLI